MMSCSSIVERKTSRQSEVFLVDPSFTRERLAWLWCKLLSEVARPPHPNTEAGEAKQP